MGVLDQAGLADRWGMREGRGRHSGIREAGWVGGKGTGAQGVWRHPWGAMWEPGSQITPHAGGRIYGLAWWAAMGSAGATPWVLCTGCEIKDCGPKQPDSVSLVSGHFFGKEWVRPGTGHFVFTKTLSLCSSP